MQPGVNFATLCCRRWRCVAAAATLLIAASGLAAERKIVSLNGAWQFQTNGASAWTKANLPANWEQHAPTNFDGIGWFRRDIGAFSVPAGHRALLRFDAAATSAEVYWNGTGLGTHLGGWTPFRFDVTEHVRSRGTNEIIVWLDEKVGHNTQG